MAVVVCEVLWYEDKAEEGDGCRLVDKTEEAGICRAFEGVCQVDRGELFLLVLVKGLLLELGASFVLDSAELALNPIIAKSKSLYNYYLINSNPVIDSNPPDLCQEVYHQTVLTP